jgi:hypothetical protein
LLATPPSTSTATTESSTTCKKGLQTNFSCAICSKYGHYTHHFPSLPQFHQTLAAVHHTSLPEPPQALPTQAHITNIRYISLSVPEQMRYHPQCLEIWFMSNEPSHPVHNIPSMSSTLEDNNIYPLTVPPAISQDPMYSRIFHCDEYILEEMTTHDFPWNALHHQALFLSQEVFHPPTLAFLCATKTNDFISSGHIDRFKKPIPATDSFKEGAYISTSLEGSVSKNPSTGCTRIISTPKHSPPTLGFSLCTFVDFLVFFYISHILPFFPNFHILLQELRAFIF